MNSYKFLPIIFCFMLVTFLPISGGMESRASDFPDNNNLAQRNVALKMWGSLFTSGLRKNNQGKPNCDGAEVLAGPDISWDGSGFIVKSDGTIVTNYHVAKQALYGKAIFDDGASYEIRHIKVYDEINDLAVLKIKSTKNFPVAKLGDSDKVQPRDEVLAVGNPLAMGMNITEGKVSQVVKDKNEQVALLRHTAPIAPGSSGGALYKGDEVVGVNVSAQLYNKFNAPSGFNNAIPINKVKSLLQNPAYQKNLPLENIFPKDINLISQRVSKKAISAINGQVPAKAGNKPGIKSITFDFYPLEDIYFYLESPGSDLLFQLVNRQNQMIGCGDKRVKDYDVLLKSSGSRQRVYIDIFNFDSQPANFGLKIYKLTW